MTADIVNRRLRLFLMGLAVLALMVTTTELWLQDHTKEALQWLPWGLCGIGFLALLVAFVRPSRVTVLALRVVMAIVALGGVIGIGVHLNANIEFQQEIHPTEALGDFFIAALKGAAPLLAPGALIFAALIAIATTYHHPALSKYATQKETVRTKVLQ